MRERPSRPFGGLHPPCEYSGLTVSFRQACLNVFCMIASVVVFRIQEDDHGWTKTSRDSGGSDTWAGSL